MSKEQFVTVKEFSIMAGVSTQAVYKRLRNDLINFATVENGRKMVSTSALEYFDVKQVSKVNCQQVDNLQTEFLIKTLEVLREQLAEKDRQIDSLLLRLEDAQRSEHQANALHAGTIQNALEQQSQQSQVIETRRRWKFWQS